MSKDFGDTATGAVVNVHDWGGKNPVLAQPRRYATGTVNQLFPNAPNVVGVLTASGHTSIIRTDVQPPLTARTGKSAKK